MEELAEAQAKADALIRDLQNQQEDVSKVRAELEADRKQVRIANEDAARYKALAASELAKAKSEAANIRRDAQQEREREAAEAQQIRERLGLNDPLLVQFADWGWRLLQGDFGESILSGTSVTSTIPCNSFPSRRGLSSSPRAPQQPKTF